MKGLPGDHPGQMQRANLVHNVSAVTGACLAVEKKKFIKINGFDEHNLKVAFNDVDLCLRLMEEGFTTCIRHLLLSTTMNQKQEERGYTRKNKAIRK